MARYFESVKRAAYNTLVGNPWVDNTDKIPFSIIPLLQTIEEGKHKRYHKRMEENKKKLNEALDRWDIRAVGALIDVLPKRGSGVPGWILKKDFVIDYNGRGELDLIRNQRIF